jgi:MoaA/NifB/PqqE/SkfB family radical SAM enzyme
MGAATERPVSGTTRGAMDLFVEIDTRCNARCFNCDTGNKSRNPHRKSMDVELFERVLDHALAIGVADRSSSVYLFDRGEPTLHPEFSAIVRALHRRNLGFCISSNCGFVPRLDDDISMRGLKEFSISMPGFSQASYDRIHRLPFRRVLSNVDAMLADWRARGFCGEAVLRLHVYRFNLEELAPAEAWSRDRGIVFSPYCAFFADFKMQRAFATDTMAPAVRARAEQTMFLDVLRDHLRRAPADYGCPQQRDRLNINERGELALCCGVPRNGDSYEDGYVLGNFLDLTADDIARRKTSAAVCGECIASGNAFLNFELIRPHELNFQERLASSERRVASGE